VCFKCASRGFRFEFALDNNNSKANFKYIRTSLYPQAQETRSRFLLIDSQIIMQEHSAYPDMVMMSPDQDGHPQQQAYHRIDLHQDEAQQEPYYQCNPLQDHAQQKPLDETMLDPVLRSDVADDRPFVYTPIQTPGILYDSFRNLSSLNQPPLTFALSPALQTLRGISIMKNVE
jgi:hypothetical protein